MYGTVIAIMGAISSDPLMSDYQGRVADPPIIAKVSMAVAGARVVKKEVWMTFDDFLRV